MTQIQSLWTNMDPRRRIIVILATLAVFAAVFGLSRIASQPSYSLLYSGLENGQAGDVVRALEQRGVTYEVRGGSIYVEGRLRDELRMTLASEGLPRNSSQGYELLDSLSGFGTTSQMFDAAYWRAKEGELARTIAASPQVESARVHIAHQGANPFARDIRPTASVVVTASGDITPAQAKALRYLVSSAVAGLNADDVSIIDSNGELIVGTEEAATTGADDKSEQLRERVQRLLEARVGRGNAVVEVSVDTVTEQETIHQRTIDPQSRVAISTDTSEQTDSSQNSGGGDVTVASNLPNGQAGGGDSSSSSGSETRERVNYEVSETQRELLRTPGAIKRITVAVLVNGLSQGEGDQATVVARDAEELQELQELVSSAVGFDEARGDVITIKSMSFEPVPPLGTAATPGFFDRNPLDIMALLKAGILGLVALALGLFVVRPILKGAGGDAPLLNQGMLADGRGGMMDDGIFDGQASDAGDIGLPDFSMGGGFPSMDEIENGASGPRMILGEDADPVEKLQHMLSERRDETLEILRSWLEEDEEETA